MTTDTIAKIKDAEREAGELVEKTKSDESMRLRAANAECEKRIKEESEKLRRKFDEEIAAAGVEAASLCSEEEIASFSEAEKFIRAASARLPDTVRFIVGGIIGKWQ